jgi:aldose 1-epimerase
MPMFTVEDLSLTEGKVVMWSNRSRVEVLPGCGAILNAWFTQTAAGDTINIIEGFDSPADFADAVTSKGFRNCKMNPFVGRISKDGYEFAGQQYHPQKFALKGLPIHGLVYDAAYDVVHTHADENGVVLQLETCYPGTDPGYPFQYTVMVEYLLLPNETLTINTIVLNQHEEVIPVSDGWHPYFKLGGKIDDCTLEMATDNLLEFNEDLVPTGDVVAFSKFQHHEPIGTTEMDNSFLLQHPLPGPACSFSNPANGLKLQVWPDASYPILHFYTPPDRQSLAIENTSAAPDAFNNRIGLLYLQPGESHAFSTTFKIIAH